MTKINPDVAADMTMHRFRDATVVLADGSEQARVERVLVFVPTHRSPTAGTTEFERVQVSLGVERPPVFAERVTVVGDFESATLVDSVPLWVAQKTFGDDDVQAGGVLHPLMREVSWQEARASGRELVDEPSSPPVTDDTPFGKVRTRTYKGKLAMLTRSPGGGTTVEGFSELTIHLRTDAVIETGKLDPAKAQRLFDQTDGRVDVAERIAFDHAVVITRSGPHGMTFTAGNLALLVGDLSEPVDGFDWLPLPVIEAMQLNTIEVGTVNDALEYEAQMLEAEGQHEAAAELRAATSEAQAQAQT